MECKFTVGQKVVWVESEPCFGSYGEICPVAGPIYTVRTIGIVNGGVGMRLDEIHNEPRLYTGGVFECAFRASHFRPVKTTQTDISVFTEIVRREFDVDKVVKPVKEIA